MAQVFLDLYANKCTGVVTNVPGPTAPIHLSRKMLHDAIFNVPQRASMALGVSFMTYRGRLYVGFNAATNVVSDAAALSVEFEHELARLSKEVGLQ